MGFRLGFLGKLYYSSAGPSSYSSPVWVQLVQVKDVTVPIEDDEVELDSRASTFHQFAQGLRAFGLEFKMVYDPTMSDVKFVVGAMWNRTAVDVIAMDEAITGVGGVAYGWRMVGCILKLGKDEALAVGQTYDFSIKPTITSTLHDPAPVKSDGNGNIASWDFT